MKTLCFIIAIFFSAIGHTQIITTIAGTGVSGFSGEGGPATNAEFVHPAGVCADKWGNIYIVDRGVFVVQKIDTNGILSRFAGNGSWGAGGDAGPATAASLYLGFSIGLAVDTAGYVYIACFGKVRRVSPSGIITSVAGTGITGNSGDGGPATAAQFKSITGLCFDKSENLYIADEGNSNIRMVNTSGIITTIAGTTFGFSGDGGPATNAQFKEPQGIAVDDVGNIYVSDGYNYRVRKINTAGIISTIAGGGGAAVTVCFGCAAEDLRLAGPTGMAVDKSGNVYVSAISDNAVYKITPAGKFYNIAGTVFTGFSGDGGPATDAQLNAPTMICLDNSGNVLIVDKGNIRIRKVWLDGTVHTPPATTPLPLAPGLLIAPNPVTQKNITCTVQSDTNENAGLLITDVLGRVVTTASCTTNTTNNISLPLPSGMYFISATTASGLKMSAKVVVQ